MASSMRYDIDRQYFFWVMPARLIGQALLLLISQQGTLRSFSELPENWHQKKFFFTMAQQFLDGLPKANIEDLPGDSSCMICQDVYGTEPEEDGTVESAVRLPCGHDIGADCIRTWLSAEKEAKTHAQHCRVRFFPAQPRPYMEHGAFEEEEEEEDDEEDDWHGARGRVDLPRRADPGAFFLEVLRMVGEAGQVPQEGQEVARTEAGEEDRKDRIRSWWPEFFETTTEQYEESIRRARAVITTPRVPPPGANMNYWLPYPYLQLSVSEPIIRGEHELLVAIPILTAQRI